MVDLLISHRVECSEVEFDRLGTFHKSFAPYKNFIDKEIIFVFVKFRTHVLSIDGQIAVLFLAPAVKKIP